MTEMPHAGEEHRNSRIVRCGYYLFVPDRPARLDHGCGAGFGSREKAVGKGEEGVGRDC